MLTSLGDNTFIIKTETEGDLEFLNHVNAFSVNPARVKVFDCETGRVFGDAAAAGA